MSEIEIVLPKLGESIQSATVLKWLKKVGENVKEDEPLLEVTTDKVNSEIPSTVSGVLKTILVPKDMEVEVGQKLAVIETHSGHVVVETPRSEDIKEEGLTSKGNESAFLSPAVLSLAKDAGLSMQELQSIQGTGNLGRVTKQDIKKYLADQKTLPKTLSEGIEKIKMSPLRKSIAENMVKSFYQAPHASLVTEVDVTNLNKEIRESKEEYFAKKGFKLSITSYIAKAICQALETFPLLNASLDQETILVKHFINLGIAISVEQGVMVPVIKDANKLTLDEMAKAISDISNKTRENSLSPEDTQAGTITMTNFGMADAIIGIPILKYPEVAIIGVGAITKKVKPLENNSFGVRETLYLSLTFDHRVFDGIYGCNFLKSIKKSLEND